jgi:hypothetical protein
VYPGRRNVFFHPNTGAPYEPAAELLTEYRFASKTNAHYMCQTCGCHVFEYGARPVDDPRPPEAQGKEPWAPENGWNGSFGLNIALLNDAGAYLEDVHGLGVDYNPEEDTKGVVLKGLIRDRVGKKEEPVYTLRL